MPRLTPKKLARKAAAKAVVRRLAQIVNARPRKGAKPKKAAKAKGPAR